MVLVKQAIRGITKSIDKHTDDSQRQIRDTKRLLQLSSADGLLVLLNDSIAVLGQPLVQERLGLAIQKNDGQGQPYHQDVTRFLYISEANVVETVTGNKRVNTTYGNPRVAEKHGVEAFVYRMAKGWAEWCGEQLEPANSMLENLMTTSKLYVDVS